MLQNMYRSVSYIDICIQTFWTSYAHVFSWIDLNGIKLSRLRMEEKETTNHQWCCNSFELSVHSIPCSSQKCLIPFPAAMKQSPKNLILPVMSSSPSSSRSPSNRRSNTIGLTQAGGLLALNKSTFHQSLINRYYSFTAPAYWSNPIDILCSVCSNVDCTSLHRYIEW